MEGMRERLKLLLPLLALVYLGFYFYGIILGVFGPLELIGFTIIAVVLALGVLIWAFALRHGWTELGEPTKKDEHRIRAQRERRGF